MRWTFYVSVLAFAVFVLGAVWPPAVLALSNCDAETGHCDIPANEDHHLVKFLYEHSDTEELESRLKALVKDATKDDLTAALFAASRKGISRAVKILVSHGADLKARQKPGVTPLIEAAIWGHKETLEALVSLKANVDAKDWKDRTALIFAAEKGHVEIVSSLIASRANLDLHDRDGRTALLEATRKANTEIVRLLLEAGANPNLLDKDDLAPLHVAAPEGLYDISELLLKHKADPNLRGPIERTALHLVVCERVKPNLIRLLISSGASLSQADRDGISPIVQNTICGNVDALREILRAKIPKEDLNRALLKAAAFGHATMVNMLLNKGADINGKNEIGSNALLLATDASHQDVVNLLIKRGADINAENSDGFTPLMQAFMRDNMDAAKALLEAGAHPGEESWLGTTGAYSIVHYSHHKELLEKYAKKKE